MMKFLIFWFVFFWINGNFNTTFFSFIVIQNSSNSNKSGDVFYAILSWPFVIFMLLGADNHKYFVGYLTFLLGMVSWCLYGAIICEYSTYYAA